MGLWWIQRHLPAGPGVEEINAFIPATGQKETAIRAISDRRSAVGIGEFLNDSPRAGLEQDDRGGTRFRAAFRRNGDGEAIFIRRKAMAITMRFPGLPVPEFLACGRLISLTALPVLQARDLSSG